MNNNFYLTTPIFYVNDVPHIGHAYTTIVTDVIARFHRLMGDDVMFLTGTDEHGQKVEKAANQKDLDPQIFTDQVSMHFRNAMKIMNISNDDFIRTTEVRHKKAVEHFWNKLVQSGNIYLGKYAGWYSMRDEAFYAESELTSEGLAPTGAPVEWVEEPSYFFALSKWQDKLLEFYENNPGFIFPGTRRNEVISFVKSGLTDLSISRTSFNWGIKVPEDPKHVIYVWLDALVNYISALGWDENSPKYHKYWPANAHIVGKDILRFHAVYWPAFLMAAELELPKCVVAHGWWTNEGQKISKSLGNTIDPLKLIDEFGLDPVRYFLVREVQFGNDGNYVRDNLISRINSELSNKIGNLLQRTCAFIVKNNNSQIPTVSQTFIKQAYQEPLLSFATYIVKDNIEKIQKFEINGILDNIVQLAEKSNVFIDEQAPWQLKDNNPQLMQEVLFVLLESLRYVGVMLQPFVPDSAKKMLDQLGSPIDQRNFEHLNINYALEPGSIIATPTAVFPRFIKEQAAP